MITYGVLLFTLHFATINTNNIIVDLRTPVLFTLHFATINTLDTDLTKFM